MKNFFPLSCVALTVITMTMAFSACCNSDDAFGNDQTVKVSEISIDRAAMALAEGNTATIKATILPSNASDPSLTWTSSDENKVAVDKNTGVVKANSMGGSTITFATITATANDGSGAKAKCIVGVNDQGITFAIDRQTMTLAPGDKGKIKTIMESASAPKLIWSSSNENIARVDDGTVEAINPGTATINIIASPANTLRSKSVGALSNGDAASEDGAVKLTCAVNVTDDNILSGEFSVSDTKKVKFTKGNMYYSSTDSKYHLETAQNTIYGTYEVAYNAKHVYHFYWVTPSEANNASTAPWALSYGDDHSARPKEDKFFCGEDNKMTVDGTEGLYAMTQDEWSYLLGSNTTRNGKYALDVSVTIGDKTVDRCLVLAPDGYTDEIASSYDAAAWATAEANGLVCLPAGGRRATNSLDYGGTEGLYWTASPDQIYGKKAYNIYFGSNGFKKGQVNVRDVGFLVRLVKTVE